MDAFYDRFKVMVAYPRTRNVKDTGDFTTTCHYTCNETDSGETECDFSLCKEKIKTIQYPNQDVKTFVYDFVSNIQNEKLSDSVIPKYLANKVDGYQIVYRPETDMKAYNIIHFRRDDATGASRTGFIELNKERFAILNTN